MLIGCSAGDGGEPIEFEGSLNWIINRCGISSFSIGANQIEDSRLLSVVVDRSMDGQLERFLLGSLEDADANRQSVDGDGDDLF